MALRQRQPVASTSAAVPITSPSLPPSIAHLTPGQIKTLKQTIITEHFGFAPETFAKSGSDAVNTIVWVAVGKLGEWIRENRAELDDDDEIDAVRLYVVVFIPFFIFCPPCSFRLIPAVPVDMIDRRWSK